MSAAVKTNDREGMADALEALGLYATGNDVRRGRSTLTKGVAHVRDYCLPKVLTVIEREREYVAKYPPIPGTVGAAVLPGLEGDRDRLRAFLADWAPYDIAVRRPGVNA